MRVHRRVMIASEVTGEDHQRIAGENFFVSETVGDSSLGSRVRGGVHPSQCCTKLRDGNGSQGTLVDMDDFVPVLEAVLDGAGMPRLNGTAQNSTR